jgi:hypothetical protein
LLGHFGCCIMRATKSTLRMSQVHAIARGLVPCAVTFSVKYSRALEENAGRASWLLHSAPNRTLRKVLPGAVPKLFDVNSFFNCSIFSYSTERGRYIDAAQQKYTSISFRRLPLPLMRLPQCCARPMLCASVDPERAGQNVDTECQAAGFSIEFLARNL